jgi:hypothetical protein
MQQMLFARLISHRSTLLFSLFAWLISHQPAVLFSHNKPATSNQPAVLLSQNKPVSTISHQPNEQALYLRTNQPLAISHQ